MSAYEGYISGQSEVMMKFGKDIKSLAVDDEIEILDRDWVTSRFMVPADELDVNFRVQSYKCSAHFKFQDTTIGGHRACNPPAQFTRYADIRANDFWYPWDPMTNVQVDSDSGQKVLIAGPNGKATNVVSNINFFTTTAHTGMGRFYAEALDDGFQEVYLTFGIPKFNGLLDFFKCAVSYEDAYIAKHGRVPTTYNLMKGPIAVVTAIFMPGTFLLTLLLKRGYQLIAGNLPYNYYYMEPSMHRFWSTCNNIANQIATAMGILSFASDKPEGDFAQVEGKKLTQGKAMRFDKECMNLIDENFKDLQLFSPGSNYLDIYSFVTRYQTRVNTILKTGVDKLGQGNAFGSASEMQKYQLESIQSIQSSLSTYTFLSYLAPDQKMESVSFSNDKIAFTEDMQKLTKEAPMLTEKEDPKKPKGTVPDTVSEEESNFIVTALGKAVSFIADAVKEKWTKTTKVFDANSRLATSQVIFLVQPTGATSESFSNSTGEINTGGTIKSLGQAAHNANFNFSGGRLGIGPIDAIIDSAMQVGNSLLDNLTFGASDLIRGIMAGAYVDTPKIWQDSDCSFPNITYNMDLVAPYGHPFSRFQNIVVPLSILLTGTLPLKVGKASYASPFLCSCFCQGVHHIRLGMITDLSITRGGGSLQQTIDKKTNFVSVSFTVTDFGHKINAPINNTMYAGDWFPILEEGTPFADYIDALSGKHISDLNWLFPNIKQRLSNMFKYRGIYNPTNLVAAAGTAIGNTFPLSLLFHYPAMEGNTQSI